MELSLKEDAGEPLRSALTLMIKEQTISVKHVFSAFTLYANVVRRVKVPFDEAQHDSIRRGLPLGQEDRIKPRASGGFYPES